MKNHHFSFLNNTGKIIFIIVFSFYSLLASAQSDSIKIPDQWSYSDSLIIQGQADSYEWWKLFGESKLNILMEKAKQQNTNLLTAVSRIEQAKARYLGVSSYFYPVLGVQITPLYQKSNPLLTPGMSAESAVYAAQLNLSWEIDVFGNIRNNYKAAKTEYLISNEERNGVMVSLYAQLASAYFNLRTHQMQLSVANTNLQSQKEILNITHARKEAGLASNLDVSQSESVYARTLASIPMLEYQVNEDINTISLLIGTMPGTLKPELQAFDSMPGVPENIFVGVPADIIRQRPDIRAAEKGILAQIYLMKASKADYYPKFYITGNFGYKTKDISDFGQNDFMTYQIGPTLNWNFFQGLQVREEVKQQKALLEQSELNYRGTLLNAFNEADNAIYAFEKFNEYASALNVAVISANNTLSMAIDLYRNGLIEYQNVLDAQRQVLSYQNEYVTARGNVLLSLANIYRSLGGGWQNEKQ